MRISKVPYLYVTGASYSGSTLLAFLLNAHPQMISISEMEGPVRRVVIGNYRCSCGELLLACSFYVELERRIKSLGSTFTLADWQTGFRFSESRLLNILLARPLRNVVLEGIRDSLVPFLPGYRQTVQVISRRIVHLAQAALALSGKQVFVDAQKDAIRIKFLRDIRELNLKVIHLVRDVRGAAASFMKNAGRADPTWATARWSRMNMDSERARRYVSPDQWLRISYDDLCNDTQGTMDRVADFVGVARAPIPEDFYEPEHHIIGNHMRLNGKGFGVVRPDESWKNQLTKQDLDVIARVGGTANLYFGHAWPQAKLE